MKGGKYGGFVSRIDVKKSSSSSSLSSKAQSLTCKKQIVDVVVSEMCNVYLMGESNRLQASERYRSMWAFPSDKDLLSWWFCL